MNEKMQLLEIIGGGRARPAPIAATGLIVALTPLDRTSRIGMYENNSRSSLFCRIGKRYTAANASAK